MLGALRALVLATNTAHFGVAVVVKPRERADITVGADGLPLKGIWLTDLTTEQPGGAPWPRREARKVLALRRVDVGALPEGTVIEAPPRDGDASVRWRIDGTEQAEADHLRYVLVPDE